MEITSFQNSKVKLVSLLQSSSRARKENNLFVVEGKKEFALAIKSGYKPQQIFICTNLYDSVLEIEEYNTILEYVSEAIYQKIAFRGTTEGIIGVFEIKKLGLNEITLSKKPLVLILESVEKPGNLGAILRTADATNVDAVIVCNPQTDFFNSNVIRSSIGCFFSVQTALCTNQECLNWLLQNKINYFSASLEAENFYHQINYKMPTAFILGTESEGLSSFWQQDKSRLVKIPMLGKIDSLNVSVSAAVLSYEAQRQRGF